MIKEIFQTGAEQVDDEYVVQSLLAKIVDIGNASYGKSASGSIERGMVNLRHPTRILYVRYSSRS